VPKMDSSLDGRILEATIRGKARELETLLAQNPRKLLITGGRRKAPLLHLATEHGHSRCIDILLKRGFPVDLRDKGDNATALHWAAYSGRVEIIRKLLKAGANINAEGDDHGVGIVGWCVYFSKPRRDAVSFLLKSGAQVNIFAAVALNRADLARPIVKKDPRTLLSRLPAIEHSQTALHVAVSRNLPKMVELLVKLGADVASMDSTGKTPLNLAGAKTNKRIPLALISAGANPKEFLVTAFDTAIPILNVKNVPASIEYYVRKLGFKKNWDWGEPAEFASVGRDRVEIFLCEGGQGNPGTWMWIRMQDTDALHKEYKKSGALIVKSPINYPWGSREMLVKDLDGHVLRMASEATGSAEEPHL
jgi:Ankyrin repeats (3 copies)/Glyoxalase/Bleomycin resistance protein/Dioxygenase superfamily/Ankyrin repeat